MKLNPKNFYIEVISSLNQISEKEWDKCNIDDHPFTSYGFLRALEQSGSAIKETGWMAHHLILKDKDSRVAGVSPLYLKNHSFGEYVFDWGWADAYERAGGNYYPKLQCSIPFTPVTGARLMIRDVYNSIHKQELRKILASGMIELVKKLKISSVHITFPNHTEWQEISGLGFLQRTSQQFHWENQDFKTFDDFLEKLTSRKRKAIKKERKSVSDLGLTIQTLSGKEITDYHWDAFFKFYLSTIEKKWGQNYLQRNFFSLLGEKMGNKIVLIAVEENKKLVAGALNLRDDNTLYGRNWGCLKTHKYLHFETCYYQAIEYAINNNLKWVEAGAQGQHKIQRGYLPTQTFSLHWVADPSLRKALKTFLDKEQNAVNIEIEGLMKLSPYRKDNN
jgi:predicted N-acyltransferase